MCDRLHCHSNGMTLRSKTWERCFDLTREKIGYDLDRATNLEAFPSKDQVYPDGAKVLHRGSHPEWSKHANEVLEESADDLKKAYGSLDKVPKDVLKETMKDVENQLGKDVQNIPKGLRGGWLKQTPHGNYKISDNAHGKEKTA